MRHLFLAIYYGLATWLPDSYTPVVGPVANWLRVRCCHHIFRRCGQIITVNRRAYFGSGRDVEIGDRSGIGAHCQLPNDVVIGSDVMMAPEVLIFSRNHRTDRTDIPMGQQGYQEPRPVHIGNDVWLGQRCIINAGRTIADGTVVAAGAVVTKNFPPNSIIGGNPAQVIRTR